MSIQRQCVIDREEFAELVEKMSALLAGREATLQGAVLADLTALWLAGHFLYGQSIAANRAETDRLREELLAMHVGMIRELIPVNERHVLLKVREGR